MTKNQLITFCFDGLARMYDDTKGIFVFEVGVNGNKQLI